MNQIIASILQIMVVLAVAPLATGLVRFIKARLQGRKGASPFLPYLTLATLFKKEIIIPQASSWVFRAVPFVVLTCSFALAAIMPLVFHGGFFAVISDFFVVAGILLIGSIFLVLGGLDPGSAFGGMGSSREMTIAALLEPTIIMIFSAIGFLTGSFTIDGMVVSQIVFANPFAFLLLISLALVALAENTRYPVDNPATHLELTMVHEAMILEYSGPYLAMLEYAAAIKLTVFSLVISNFIFPTTLVDATIFGAGDFFGGIVWTLAKVILVMALLALLESTIVKMRFYRMSEYLSIAFFTAFFGMVLLLISASGAVAVRSHVFFAALAVFLVIMLFGRVRLKAILRYYAFSSFAIAGIALSLSFILPESERMHLWIFSVVTLIIKTWGVPYVINKATHAKKSLTNLPSFLKPGASYFLAVVILMLTFFILRRTPLINLIEWSSLLYASVALLVLGLMMLIIQRNVFSQIIGLLVIENGITVFVLATVESLPLLIEMGVFLITVISAFILSMLSARIAEFNGSADTEQLRKITE